MRNMWPIAGVVVLAVLPAAAEETSEATFGAAEGQADGVLVHRGESPRQAGPTEVRVLLPAAVSNASPAATQKLPVVYLLPVETGRESRYGDAMAEAVRLDMANRYGVIVVAPTFAALPWYADHPTDPRLAQEAYFLRDVVPFVERTYPALAEPRGRLLVGFSKSGWGAWSLLLRNPEVFGRAASWDAPLTMGWPSKYGSGPIFGTEENFAKYRITKLLDERAELLRTMSQKAPRLILLGRGNFTDHEPIHELLERLRIPHVYHDGSKTPHVWDRIWLEPALEAATK